MRKKVRLFHLLGRAQRLTHLAAERASVEALGVTPVQLGLLYALSDDAALPMAEIGRLLDLSPAGLSGLAGRMEEAGLVRRDRDAGDARVVRLRITAHGAEMRERSLPFLKAFNAQLVAGLSDAERAAVVKFLESLVTRFGANQVQGEPDVRTHRR